MANLSSLRAMKKILWVGIVGVFVVAEVVAFLEFWSVPGGDTLSSLGQKLFVAFIVALPMIAGINGYRSVKRRISTVEEEAISVLSIQFLFTIATAYAALLVCLGPIVKAARLLK